MKQKKKASRQSQWKAVSNSGFTYIGPFSFAYHIMFYKLRTYLRYKRQFALTLALGENYCSEIFVADENGVEKKYQGCLCLVSVVVRNLTFRATF